MIQLAVLDLENQITWRWITLKGAEVGGVIVTQSLM